MAGREGGRRIDDSAARDKKSLPRRGLAVAGGGLSGNVEEIPNHRDFSEEGTGSGSGSRRASK
jgi:hypothetical protein